MISLHHVHTTALALCGAVFTAWSAPITYPNQAYTYHAGALSPAPGAFNVKAVAVEGERGLAVLRDGRVLAWGFPDFWLTNGILDRFTNAVAVGLNYTGAAVLTEDGRVIELEAFSSQQPVVTNAMALDVSGQFNDDDLDYMLAVTQDGRVVVWGRYEGWHPPSADVSGVIAAAGGWSHIVALKNDGTVIEWGTGSSPAVVDGLSNVVAVAAGGEHSVALKADGTVVAWGRSFFGETNVPVGLSDVIAISAAEYHTLALKRDGTLVAWGTYYLGEDVTPPQNLSNVVAIATSASRDVVISALPVPPPITYPNQAFSFSGESFAPVPGFTNIKALAVEGDDILAVTQDGRVIGNGGMPVGQVSNAVAVGLSYVQSAALTTDGRVIEFDSGYAQPPGLTNVIAFDVAGQFNDDDLDYKLAVTQDGQVVVWGHYGHPPSAEISGVIDRRRGMVAHCGVEKRRHPRAMGHGQRAGGRGGIEQCGGGGRRRHSQRSPEGRWHGGGLGREFLWTTRRSAGSFQRGGHHGGGRSQPGLEERRHTGSVGKKVLWG